MSRLLPILLLGLVVAATECAGQGKTPAEEFKALLKEFQAASSGTVRTDAERLKFVGQVYRQRSKLAQKLVELAEEYPRDPVAFDALAQAVWAVNTTPWPVELVGDDPARGRALALLARDHMKRVELGEVCERFGNGFAKEYETFLRAVLENSPRREARGRACLSLAQFLNTRLERLALIDDEPALGKEFAGLFGKAYLDNLQRQDRARVGREAEALLEQAAEKFGDVKIYGGTVGAKAKATLFEVRHLSVGKEAPDIEGEDQDGKRFKLSDYRGKVVLLDFWHQQ